MTFSLVLTSLSSVSSLSSLSATARSVSFSFSASRILSYTYNTSMQAENNWGFRPPCHNQKICELTLLFYFFNEKPCSHVRRRLGMGIRMGKVKNKSRPLKFVERDSKIVTVLYLLPFNKFFEETLFNVR
jgi:hypothetical protein